MPPRFVSDETLHEIALLISMHSIDSSNGAPALVYIVRDTSSAVDGSETILGKTTHDLSLIAVGLLGASPGLLRQLLPRLFSLA